jgi:purine/pyrimidine-nucleoside phosphorylase
VKHNSYFEGRVQSLALNESEGPATIGVIEPGSYTFSTSSEERMSVVAGSLRAKLPGCDWKEYSAGQSFTVPPKHSFDIEARADAAYICRYR